MLPMAPATLPRTINRMLRAVLVGVLALAMPACSKSSDQAVKTEPGAPAGKVIEVTGHVTADREVSAGTHKVHPLAVGDTVSGDDTIETAEGSTVKIELAHNHVELAVGPSEKKRVDTSVAWSAPMKTTVAKAGEADTAAAGRPMERSAADGVATADMKRDDTGGMPAPAAAAPPEAEEQPAKNAAPIAPPAAPPIAPPKTTTQRGNTAPPPGGTAASATGGGGGRGNAQDDLANPHTLTESMQAPPDLQPPPPPPDSDTKTKGAIGRFVSPQVAIDSLLGQHMAEMQACITKGASHAEFIVNVDDKGKAQVLLFTKLRVPTEVYECVSKIVEKIEFPHVKASTKLKVEKKS
jgi:hypothetical protein